MIMKLWTRHTVEPCHKFMIDGKGEKGLGKRGDWRGVGGLLVDW